LKFNQIKMALDENTDKINIDRLTGLITTSDYLERAYAESEAVRERVRAVVYGYNPNPNTESGLTSEVPGGDYAEGKRQSHLRHKSRGI